MSILRRLAGLERRAMRPRPPYQRPVEAMTEAEIGAELAQFERAESELFAETVAEIRREQKPPSGGDPRVRGGCGRRCLVLTS